MNYKRLFFYVLLILTFVMFAGFAKAVSINEAVLYGQESLNTKEALSDYQAEDKVSCLDTVTLLCRAHNVMNDTSYVLKYDENSVFNYALENGIVDSLEDFDASDNVKRYKLAQMVVNTFGSDCFLSINDVSYIPDVHLKEEYFNDVLTLYNAGIFTGRDEYGNFYPEEFINRDELVSVLERCAVQENRKKFSLKEFKGRNPAVYLIEDESMIRGVRKVQYVASGWNFESSMVYGKDNSDYSFNSFSDISTTQSASIKKEIKTVTEGNVVFECEYNATSSGARVCFEDMSGMEMFEITGGSETYIVKGAREEDTRVKCEAGTVRLRIFMDIDNLLAQVYINGEDAGLYDMAKVDDLSRVVIGTTEQATLTITVNSVFMFQNFHVNDDFRMEYAGTTPLNWIFSDSADIINMNCDTDTLTGVISDDGYAVRKFEKICDSFVVESYVRIDDNQNAVMSVLDGDNTIVSISAHNGVFKVGDDFLRNYTPGVWQQVRLEVDTSKDTALVKINGKECITVLFTADSVDTVKMIASGSGDFNFDDVKVFNTYEYADYCPEPVPVNDDEWYSGMSICSLWREGSHYGWDCISPYEDLTPVLGYYDEGIPEAMDWEIKFMAEHGYDYQRFCWYYGGFSEHIKKPRLCDDAIHDGYFNAKYSNMLDFSLMWENAGSKGTKEEFYNDIWPYWVDWYLTDERYFCIDNKPVITIYSSNSFVEIMGGVEGAKECVDFMRNECIKLGYDGLIVYVSTSTVGNDNAKIFETIGYDSGAAYHFDEPAYDIEYQKSRMNAILNYNSLHYTPSVGIGFNDIGWTETRSPLATPDDFEKLLVWARDEYLPAWKEKGYDGWQVRSLMTNTWNEFGEGHYVFPSSLHGFGYLDAHRRVFSSVAGKDDCGHEDVVPTLSQKERLGYLYSGRCIPLRKTQYDDGFSEDSSMFNAVVKWDFESVNDCYLWGPLAKVTNPVYDSEKKALFGTTTSNDGHIKTLDFVENRFNADKIIYFHVCMMTDAFGASTAELYFKNPGDASFTAGKGKSFSIVSDGKFHDYYVELSTLGSWMGNIEQLRFDPMNVPGDFYIKKIEFLEYNSFERLDINVDSVKLHVPPDYFAIDGDEVYAAGNPTSGFYSAQQIYYEWNRQSGVLYLKTNNGTEFEFVVGSKIAKVNSEEFILERKISLVDGLVMIPLSFVYEHAGYAYSISDRNTLNVEMLDKEISQLLANRKELQFEFNIPGDNENWFLNGGTGGVNDGVYRIDSKFNGIRYDPQISIRTSFSSASSHIAKVRIKPVYADTSSTDTSVVFFFTTSSDNTQNEAKAIRRYMRDYTPDKDGYYTITFDFKENEHWNYNISGIRFDPPNRAGTYFVDYIRFEHDKEYLEQLEKEKEEAKIENMMAEISRLGKPFYVFNADAELDTDMSMYSNSMCSVKIVDDDLKQGNKAMLVSTDISDRLVWTYLTIPTRFTQGVKYKVEFDIRAVGDIYGNAVDNMFFAANFKHSQINEDGTLSKTVDHSVAPTEGGTVSTSNGWKHRTLTYTVGDDSPTRTYDAFSIYASPVERDGVYYNYEYMIDNIKVSVADYYFEFNKLGKFEGWTAYNSNATVSGGNFIIQPTKNSTGVYDPNVCIRNLDIDADRFTKLKVRVKADVGQNVVDDQFAIYFGTDEQPELSESKTVKVSMSDFEKDSNGYYNLEFDMTRNKYWDGSVNTLRFDPIGCEGVFYVDYIYVDLE